MVLPLYNFSPGGFATAHPGLVFDKYPCLWAMDNNGDWSIPDGVKKSFYEQVISVYRSNNLNTGLNDALSRQRNLVENILNGKALEMKTNWRFVSGLGASHPYEAGFIWHRTLGVPYLPGSSVKGMMRAWAEHWQEDDSNEVSKLFGPPEGSREKAAGSLIVFDALPASVPKLEIDILNPHYQDYYDDPVTNPPADYLNPVPVFFLTVAAGQDFLFFVSPRPGAHAVPEDAAKDLEKGMSLLEAALSTIGAGGKTAVGYGTMRSMNMLEGEVQKKALQWVYETIEKLNRISKLNENEAKNLWKSSIADEWQLWNPPDSSMKEIALQEIKNKWREFGFSWANPTGKSAIKAKMLFGNNKPA